LFIKDVKEAKNIANLHTQIVSCDNTLEVNIGKYFILNKYLKYIKIKRIESMLNEFQNNLGSISNEIQTLQQQSVLMNVKLKNRQSIRGELSQYISEMVVSQQLIDNILNTPCTDRQFIEQLHELNHKLNFIKEQSLFRDAKSCKEVNEILEKLKIKAISKIRDFIIQKILQLRKPMSNYEIIQNQLLKSRFFYEFLLANERNISKECRDEYVNTLSKVYYSYFKEYSSKISKLLVCTILSLFYLICFVFVFY
jgi:vacuolar protein sorting-associated protein 52